MMKILVDTHLLIWHAHDDMDLYAPKLKSFFDDKHNELYFSSVSLWELAIKSSLGKPDFNIQIELFTQGLLLGGFIQLPIKNKHLFKLKNLPQMPKHKDPFDRLLIAQAKSEHCQFLTVDEKILAYPYDFIIK